MTKRIGNKHEAQHRGRDERLDIRRTNIEREAVKQLIARAKYRNQVKGQPPMSLSASAA